MDIETFIGACITIFWDSDTRIYHMLGRRDIRSYVYFISMILSLILLEGVTTRPCEYAHLDLITFMFMLMLLFILIFGDEDGFGWYACLWSCMAGG